MSSVETFAVKLTVSATCMDAHGNRQDIGSWQPMTVNEWNSVCLSVTGHHDVPADQWLVPPLACT